jgi:hypothetical protein
MLVTNIEINGLFSSIKGSSFAAGFIGFAFAIIRHSRLNVLHSFGIHYSLFDIRYSDSPKLLLKLTLMPQGGGTEGLGPKAPAEDA